MSKKSISAIYVSAAAILLCCIAILLIKVNITKMPWQNISNSNDTIVSDIKNTEDNIAISVQENPFTSNSEVFTEYESDYVGTGKKPLAFSVKVSNQSDCLIYNVEVDLKSDILRDKSIFVLRSPGSFIDGWVSIEPSESFQWSLIVLVDEKMAQEEILEILNNDMCRVTYKIEK